MTYTELCGKFNFPMPDYAKAYYEDFIAQYDRTTPVLPPEKAILVAEKTNLPDEAKDTLVKCAKAIEAFDDAHLCASFLAYITVYKRVPWVNHIYSDDLFTVEGLNPEQVGWVLVSVQLANTLVNKLPPEDLNQENINSFNSYSWACFEQKGYWGILEWNWNMLCAGGCMFLFDILKYVPGEFVGNYPVITDGNSYVSLAGGEFFVNGEGDLVESKEKSVFTTSFYEDDEKYVAHVVNRDGTIESKPTEFSKSVWKDYLRGGSPVLEIHIPQRVEYTPERMKYAHKLALDFYKDFYPAYNPKAVACYSWICSPQLKRVLPENSNILVVNGKHHILPLVSSFDGDCRFLRQGTSLQKRIAEECEKGIEFHNGASYIPIDEIDSL